MMHSLNNMHANPRDDENLNVLNKCQDTCSGIEEALREPKDDKADNGNDDAIMDKD